MKGPFVHVSKRPGASFFLPTYVRVLQGALQGIRVLQGTIPPVTTQFKSSYVMVNELQMSSEI